MTENDGLIASRLAELADRLRDIKTLVASTEVGSTPPRRTRAALSLKATIEFLEDTLSFRDELLTDPLWSLLLALGDLEAGKQSELLTVATSKGRSHDPTATQAVIGIAAAYMDILMQQPGKFRKSDAAQRVADILKEEGFKLPIRLKQQKTLAGSISSWRDNFKAGPGGSHPFALRIYRLYEKEMKELRSDPEKIKGSRTWWEKRLREQVAMWISN